MWAALVMGGLSMMSSISANSALQRAITLSYQRSQRQRVLLRQKRTIDMASDERQYESRLMQNYMQQKAQEGRARAAMAGAGGSGRAERFETVSAKNQLQGTRILEKDFLGSRRTRDWEFSSGIENIRSTYMNFATQVSERYQNPLLAGFQGAISGATGAKAAGWG